MPRTLSDDEGIPCPRRFGATFAANGSLIVFSSSIEVVRAGRKRAEGDGQQVERSRYLFLRVTTNSKSKYTVVLDAFCSCPGSVQNVTRDRFCDFFARPPCVFRLDRCIHIPAHMAASSSA